jgi:N-methylhydantoinase B
MTTTLSRGTSEGIDPITFEVVRNRLSAITEEQAITLKAVSGSPVVTDATDFNVGTYLADGSIVTMGPQVLFHSGSMASVVRNIIHDFSVNPGINDGDMFILNDPYRVPCTSRTSRLSPRCSTADNGLPGSAPARTRSTSAA